MVSQCIHCIRTSAFLSHSVRNETELAKYQIKDVFNLKCETTRLTWNPLSHTFWNSCEMTTETCKILTSNAAGQNVSLSIWNLWEFSTFILPNHWTDWTRWASTLLFFYSQKKFELREWMIHKSEKKCKEFGTWFQNIKSICFRRNLKKFICGAQHKKNHFDNQNIQYGLHNFHLPSKYGRHKNFLYLLTRFRQFSDHEES